MKAWLARLFSNPALAQEPAVPAPAPAPAIAMSAPAVATPVPRPLVTVHAAPTNDAHEGIELAFFSWMIDGPAIVQAPPGTREARALHRLDQLAADTSAHAHLLPRAAAVVPQLMARLRDAESSTAQLAQFVARDLTLVAEVMRVANSVHYRRDAAIVELGHAIRLLGVAGLKSAIARSVLRPVFNARGGELVTRSAPRLWEHTEFKTQLCAALARTQGLDPFEGYLMALVHSAVWSALLRTLDSVQSEDPWCVSSVWVSALDLRRDHLFVAVARNWQLSDALTRLAGEVAQQGLAAATSPQARLLWVGDRFATLLCVPGQVAAAQSWLDSLAEPVRDCFEALREARSATPA